MVTATQPWQQAPCWRCGNCTCKISSPRGVWFRTCSLGGSCCDIWGFRWCGRCWFVGGWFDTDDFSDMRMSKMQAVIARWEVEHLQHFHPALAITLIIQSCTPTTSRSLLGAEMARAMWLDMTWGELWWQAGACLLCLALAPGQPPFFCSQI